MPAERFRGHRSFDLRESAQGTTRDGFDPARDATYLAVPLKVLGSSTTETVARAEAAAAVISRQVDHLPEVHWLTSPVEAAYALLSNVVTALEGLTAAERMVVLAAFPALDRLEDMLRPPRG